MTDPQNPARPGEPSMTPPAYQQPAYEQPTPPTSQAPAYGEYAAPGYGVPAAPAYPAGGYAPPQQNPGRTLGIVALVLAIVPVGLQLVGLILGIVALVQSRKAGQKNGIALAAIIVSAVLLVLTIVLVIVFVIPTFSAAATCAADPTAIVTVWGVELACSQIVNGTY
jgi:hypothetical protein